MQPEPFTANTHSIRDLDLAEHYRVLTEKLPMPMLIHVAGIFKYLNTRCVNLLGGESASEFIGKSVLSVIHPDHHARAMERIQRILQGEENVESIELKLIRKDGSIAWIETTGVAIAFAGQQAIYVVGQDISDRKQLEEQKTQRLREKESLYRLSQALGQAQTLPQIYEAAMDAMLPLLGADRASVLLFGNDRRMHFVASRGLSDTYMAAADGHSPWPHGASDAEPIFIDNIHTHAEMADFRPVARAEGVCGFGFVPLLHQQRLMGKFMVYFNSPRACTDTDIRLAKTIALHVALAIEREHSAQALRIAATAFETRAGIVVTDTQGLILRVNRAFSQITGYDSAEVVGKSPALLQSGRHDKSFYHVMWQSLLNQGYWEGELWNRRKNEEIYPQHLTIAAVCNQVGDVHHFVGTFTDITKQKQAQDEIHHLAFYDPLTHLANRRLLLDRLGQAQRSSERHGNWGALLYIDLDHFTSINDTQGHLAGDQMLSEIARRLKDCVRDIDTVARLGSDEFVVAIESLGQKEDEAALQAKMVALKINAALGESVTLRDVCFHSSASIGISLFKGMLETASDLIKHADIAMHQAKEAGRNAIRFFDNRMQSALLARVSMSTALRQAISKQQFLLHYQIQYDGRTQRVKGVEALIRWFDPKRGMVSPADFIGLAEDTGLILPIGSWVLQTACQQIKVWSENPATQHLRMSVNVSAKQFVQDNFVSEVEAALQMSGINPSRLKLELTEGLMLGDAPQIIEKMHQIKALGVLLSLDDFGTGYSSLSQLKKLPLDQLKIDQSFVRELTHGSHDQAIVQSIVSMGAAMRLDVIAEGVETQDQRQHLEQLGCHHFQGYYFGKPLPIAEVNILIGELETAITAN